MSRIITNPPATPGLGGVIWSKDTPEYDSYEGVEVLHYLHGILYITAGNMDREIRGAIEIDPATFGLKEIPKMGMFRRMELEWKEIMRVDTFLNALGKYGFDKPREFKEAIISYRKEHEPWPDVPDVSPPLS